MASLKDMRVRIAATKATQKITKAMQMVAASKLRRAQVAAEAARPYAERMSKVLGSIAVGGCRQRQRAQALGRHRQRQGASAGGLHRRARPVRPVQFVDRAVGARARSIRSSAKARRSRSSALAARGKTSFAGVYGKLIIETIELRGIKQIGFEQADMIAKKIVALFDAGAFDVCTLFFSRFKSVIAQIPTAQQVIPPVFEKAAASRVLRIRAGGRRNSRRVVAAQPVGAGVPRALGKRRLRAGRAHERDGQRHPQRRRNDP